MTNPSFGPENPLNPALIDSINQAMEPVVDEMANRAVEEASAAAQMEANVPGVHAAIDRAKETGDAADREEAARLSIQAAFSLSDPDKRQAYKNYPPQ